MRIIQDDLSNSKVAALLAEHRESMFAHSPPQSVHALDLAALGGADMTVWTAWEGVELLGCGALRELTADHGEIKSMRTASGHLGRGVATAILARLIEEAGNRGYRRLSLETGSGPAFDAACSLYRKFGFQDCGPFGDYGEDSFSRFMTKTL